jgi:N-acetylglucosaminyldiphosphoundecaprenol N-acetyl-beta-D-mannosaminyltransferase
MINILGINISRFKRPKVREILAQWLEENNHRFIVTPNPEIILSAQKDEELFYILNHADLAPADGFGLKIAAWWKGEVLHRYTGADLTKYLLKIAAEKNLKAAIIFWKQGLSSGDEISAAIKENFPGLIHMEMGIERKTEFSKGELAILNEFSPDIMFVALGSPWQEKIIFHDYLKIKAVKIAIGVGGSFDFLTGKIKRSPLVLRRIGLEWLWRLIKQPKRIGRIWNAAAVFTYLDIIDTFVHPHLYRSNVAAIVYKQDEKGKIYILLAERSDELHHWQLPQGGTDYESLGKSAKREIKEEMGIDVEVKKTYHCLYKYRTKTSRLLKRGYKGQCQGLAIAKMKDESQAIRINSWDHQGWQWCPLEKTIDTIHPIRREGARIFIAKFNDYLKKYERK